jgi:hypothetical protein
LLFDVTNLIGNGQKSDACVASEGTALHRKTRLAPTLLRKL